MFRLIGILFTYLLSFSARGADQGIIGGSKVVKNKYKFMVSLMYKDEDLFEGHFCGGSLIREDVVLTAAHCLVGENSQDIEVSAGRVNLSKKVNGGQRRYVSSYVIHEKYNGRSTNNDIALIFSSLDYFDNAIGDPELMFSSEYKSLRDLRRVYFNRLDDKVSFVKFFSLLFTAYFICLSFLRRFPNSFQF